MIWPWTKPVEFMPIVATNEPENILDQSSGTWKFIKQWAEEELELARKRNDAISVSAEKTAAIRGEIKTLKRLANLPGTILSRDNRLNQSKPPKAGRDDYDDE
jgi:hypothetical protein